MVYQDILRNIINKAPKIALIIVVMFTLAINQEAIFGISLKPVPKVELSTEALKKYYGANDLRVASAENALSEIQNPKGQVIGYAISSDQTTDVGIGYGGKTPIVIFLDSTKKIIGIELLANQETRRFVTRLDEKNFFESWNGKTLSQAAQMQVDAVSGVTYTSSSVIKNVEAILATVTQNETVGSANFGDYIGQFALLSTLVLAFFCFLFPKQGKPFRIPLLLLSIGVLGIWQGAFVSLELLYKWIIYGTSIGQRFGLVAILIVSIIVPLMVNKSFYCNYLCPFGAAQELLGKINDKKMTIPQRVHTAMRWVRRLVLVGVVIMMLLQPDFELANLEPFSVFVIKSATTAVLVIATVSLLASMFIQRPWCRLLCPTGELFSLLQRKIKYGSKK